MGTLIGLICGAIVLCGIYQAMRFVGVVYNLTVGPVIPIFVTYFSKGIWRGMGPNIRGIAARDN